jgi:DHA2 family multidrug resistance protein
LARGPAPAASQPEAIKRGVGILATIVQREANVQAYIDGFWITFIAAIVGLVVVSLMKPSPSHPLTSR